MIRKTLELAEDFESSMNKLFENAGLQGYHFHNFQITLLILSNNHAQQPAAFSDNVNELPMIVQVPFPRVDTQRAGRGLSEGQFRYII
jgi:hypothetical protein